MALRPVPTTSLSGLTSAGSVTSMLKSLAEAALVELLRGRLEGLGPITAARLGAPLGLKPAAIDAALVALDELDAQEGLQLLDPGRQRRLGHELRLGRQAEVQPLGQLDQVAELAQGRQRRGHAAPRDGRSSSQSIMVSNITHWTDQCALATMVP